VIFREVKGMKSFSRRFSLVLVLSLFCSFFCAGKVHADFTQDYVCYNSETLYFYQNHETRTGYVSTSFRINDLTPGKWYALTVKYAFYTTFDYFIWSCNVDDVSMGTNIGQTFYMGSTGYFTDRAANKTANNSYTFYFKASTDWLYSTLRGRFEVVNANYSSSSNKVRMYLYLESYSIEEIPNPPDSDIATTSQVQSIVSNATQEINNKLTEQGNAINDSLTNFEGAADMDASKGQLDSAINDYDSVEGSLFDSGQAAFDQFDPSSLLSFSTGIYTAIGTISQLMASIISAMGEFSVIYTVGVVLVFFGMLIGLWRFFK